MINNVRKKGQTTSEEFLRQREYLQRAIRRSVREFAATLKITLE